jgi:hypothetical protein
MKRQWATTEYVRRQRIIARREARRLASRRAKAVQRRNEGRGKSHFTAPTSLSLIDEPDETVKFCNGLRYALSRRGSEVFVDLRPVVRVSSDAMLLMRAIIDTERAFRRISGNLPSDAAIAAKFKQSGFFDGFAKTPGKLPAPKGRMQTRKRRLVESEYAGELVDFAIRNATVTDEVAEASYRCLIELMLNTHNHAAGSRRSANKAERRRMKRQLWMASVYCEDRVANFTFIDLGIGLLRSAAPKNFVRSLSETVFSYGQPRLIAEMFDGKVAASVMEVGHGLGLPDMRKSAMAGRLPGLRVLTSSVTGEVASMEFRNISANLKGTVFRWRTGPPVTGV